MIILFNSLDLQLWEDLVGNVHYPKQIKTVLSDYNLTSQTNQTINLKERVYKMKFYFYESPFFIYCILSVNLIQIFLRISIMFINIISNPCISMHETVQSLPFPSSAFIC